MVGPDYDPPITAVLFRTMIVASLDRTKTEWTETVLQLPRLRSWYELGIIVSVFHYLRCATLTTAFLQPLSQRSFHQNILYSTVIQNSYNPVQDDGKSKTFLQWMYDVKDCQGDIDAVQLLTKNGCRGLYAAQDIDQGDYIFAVPFSSALLIEKEETSDVERGYKFLQLEQELKQHPDYTHEWKPYLDMLPSRSDSAVFDATPDFWSHGQIEQLELPLCIDQILEKRKSIETMAIKRGVDVSDLQFATWLVNSRAVTIIDNADNENIDDEMINEYLGYDTTMDEEDDEDDDEGSALSTTCVLVPLMDMINHSSKDFNTMLSVMGNSEDENQIDDKDDNGIEEQLFYTVVASRDIVEGEELLISYGSQEDSSLELLLHYGFVPEHNPYDVDFIAWSGAVDEMPSCWSTSLQDDEERLEQLILSNSNSVELTILKFRIRMKKAFDDYQTLVATRRGP